MIKQRLNQAARAFLREFWAKDSLGDCQTMSEIAVNAGHGAGTTSLWLMRLMENAGIGESVTKSSDLP